MPEVARRAKIVCTLGPASAPERTLARLIRAGMDVARLNFSHGDHAEHAATLARLRRLSREIGRNVAALMDLQGPKLRIGDLAGDAVTLRRGGPFTLTTRPRVRGPEAVTVSYARLPADVERGDRILLDDGLIELEVRATTATDVACRVVTGGTLRSRKGLNLPGRKLSIPALTAKDRRDLLFGARAGVDYVALSFVREARDVEQVRRLLARNGFAIPIIAKIEKPQAIDNIEAILAAADGLMVARGDLGVELPPEQVPVLQKGLIRRARLAGKPVITATQMLESMIEHPRPTRAEASDVANAVFDGTDAVMLSAETASGKYPVEAVEMMERIIRTAEGSRSYRLALSHHAAGASAMTIPDVIGEAAARAAHEMDARLIAVFTQGGGTARLVAKYRPQVPIFAFTPVETVERRLRLVWGVRPRAVRPLPGTDALIDEVVRMLSAERRIKRGDCIVITAGTPVGQAGSTNFLKVHRVE